MAYLFSGLIEWLKGLLWQKKLEVTIVGLQASGKTSLTNVLAANQFSSDVVPTVAFNLKQVKKGNVNMKIWDLGGQPKFRNMWDRYARGADAIVYVVDSADRATIPTAASELHSLLAVQALAGVPLLVLANKNDLPEAMGVDEMIGAMGLERIRDRAVSCYSTSNKTKHNLDLLISWLTQRAH
ncbi:hypothetical protein FFLO_07071 [Filobasidium floriforme]|uniref:Uncharacterized protein n=1 Tax=Filobasidium floriforme TaxID=5210 RepID=A0A8K0JE05_9TREE|nr:ADP-ribosylation factor family-domain-containing protein [Filobasidium floriforme]KAG7527300.1 hypothetical protein FFLO_07071 [Filobasidium floriforme]KAH8085763.1 ADP-ribosylation factor family-domain-containing protein [Filobasidium floriforme]